MRTFNLLQAAGEIFQMDTVPVTNQQSVRGKN